MPSSLAAGPKFRSLRGGGKYRMVPDFIDQLRFAAADMTGANSGVIAFQIPNAVGMRGAIFLGISESHGTAGTGTFRVQKLKAASTAAAGAAAGANVIDMTAAISVAGAANTVQTIDPITTPDAAGVLANVLAPGDRVALASAAGLATVAAGYVTLRFAWL
jgi:hypothetical protein